MMMGALTAIVPSSSTDEGHVMAVIIITAVVLWSMASINIYSAQKIGDGEMQK